MWFSDAVIMGGGGGLAFYISQLTKQSLCTCTLKALYGLSLKQNKYISICAFATIYSLKRNTFS